MENKNPEKPKGIFGQDNLLKFGIPGFLIALVVYASPYVIQGWQINKEEVRKDMAFDQTAWGRYAERLEEQLELVQESLLITNAELAEVRAELRLIRQADYYAPIAMWELDRSRRVKWFNASFIEFLLKPENIESESIYDKRWEDIFAKDQSDIYNKSDFEVLTGRKPVSLYAYSLAEDKSKVWWAVTKWPIIDDQRKLQGIKGVATRLSSKPPGI